MKDCTKCGGEFPATAKYFVSEKRNKSGLGAQCKRCANIVSVSWHERNKEKALERGRHYYQENREHLLEYNKKRHQSIRGYIAILVAGIKTRCTNSKRRSYRHYGARDIRCLLTTKELYNWLMKKDIDPRKLCVHRIDNDKDYTLDNITFLNRSEHTALHWLEKRRIK